MVALGAQLFVPGERLRVIQVIGLCCAFAGIIVAFSESLSYPSLRMLIGDGMLAGAAVLWGATTVMIRATPLAQIPAAKTLLYQLLVSAVVLPLGSLLKGEGGVARMTTLIMVWPIRLFGLPSLPTSPGFGCCAAIRLRAWRRLPF